LKDFLNRIGSIRWTITILLLAAGVGAVGTFFPRRQAFEAYEKAAGPIAAKALQALKFLDFFQSMWLRVILIFLALNLLACVIVRVPAVISAIRGEAALRRAPVLVLDPADEKLSRLSAALRSLGFRERRTGGGKLYSKGTAGYILSFLAHGSLLIIMVSSLAGSVLGFVATKRIHIGSLSATAYNWKAEQDMKLPFDIKPTDIRVLPHAVSVRLGIVDIRSDKRGGVINSFEGGTFRVPGLSGPVTLEHFDIGTRGFTAAWKSPDGTLMRFGRGAEIGDSGLALVPVAYATWPERQVLVKTEFWRGGSLVKTGEIAVNHPMALGGVTVYLTDHGRDESGFPYAGFQFVRDPGKAGVWAGCAMFILSVTGALFFRHSCAVIREEDGVLKVYLSSAGDREGTAMILRRGVAGETGIDGEAIQ